MDAEVRTAILDETTDAATRASLDTHLAAIRDGGHERSTSNRMAGVSDMSCPIFGYDGHVVAALTIPFLEVIDETPHISADEAIDRVETDRHRNLASVRLVRSADGADHPQPVGRRSRQAQTDDITANRRLARGFDVVDDQHWRNTLYRGFTWRLTSV